jgi:alkylation response protein AidB-like acyl-CoA dehydrogenase
MSEEVAEIEEEDELEDEQEESVPPSESQALALKVRREARELAAAVAAAETEEEKSATFFRLIRESCIPYLPCTLRDKPAELFARSYEAVYILARVNLPLCVGFAMHQYNLAALATLPVPSAPEFENRRKILVDSIQKYKTLLAISSFGSNIRGRGTPNPNVVVRENERGEFVCNGRKNFQSMATNADLLLFSGYLPGDEMGMFYCQLNGDERVVPGPSLFAGAMKLTDTKPITFNNLVIKRRQVLSMEEWLTYHVSNYATSWFEALISAVYLGGACRALEEVRKFGRSVSHDQETLLSELDGFQLEAGRLALKHRSALAFGMSYGPLAEKYCRAVIDGVPEDEEDGLSSDLMDVSGCIKYTTTATAQEIVNGARALIGTRSMSVSHPIHALTEQICFGPLHPIIPARAEREEGEDMLGEEEYMGWFPTMYGGSRP